MSTADSIYSKWSEKDKKALKGAPEMTLESALEVLKNAPENVNARALMMLYMGVMKTTDDDGDLGQLRTAMHALFGDKLGLDKNWFKGMAKAVGRLRKQAKRGLSDIRSVTDIDASLPFDEQVKHTVAGIEFANKDKPTLFRTVEGVARIRRLSEAKLVKVQWLDRDSFTSYLETVLTFYEEDGEGRRVSKPAPKELVRHLHTRADELPVPYLEGLVRSPVFGRGGLIAEPGFHASEHLYLELAPGLVVPEVPKTVTEDALKEARRLIVEEWLGDFPFDGLTRAELEAAALGGDKANPPPASMLNLIGSALEQLVRPLINGPLPMTLIDAPSPGTGKGKLAGQLQILTDGESAEQAFPKREEEVEKRFLGTLQSGKQRVLYDNVNGLVNSTALAMVLTSGTFVSRALGKTGEVEVPVSFSVTMTGNNPRFTHELIRRLNRIRLDARMADPSSRDGWRHSDLNAWVRKNRGKLIWALMVLVRNWHQQGKPGPVCPVVWGSYEAYVRVVGGIVGAAAPNWTTWQTNRDALVAESDEDDPIKQLLAVWWTSGHRRLPFNAKKGPSLSGLIMADEIELDVARLNGGSQYEYNAGSMGKFLAQQADRVFNIGEYLELGKPFEVEIEKGKHTSSGTAWIIKESKSQRVDGHGADNVVEGGFGGGATSTPPNGDTAETPDAAAAPELGTDAVKHVTAPPSRTKGWTHPETRKTYFKGEAHRMRKEYEEAQAG